MFVTTCYFFPISLMLLLLCPQQVDSSLIIPSVLTDESDEWFIPVLSVESPGYLNSWAVTVNEGDHVPDEIADQYGFINCGKVGNLKNIYHFILPEPKNKLLQSLTERLHNDTRVTYIEQQQRKVHTYRGFSFPDDPLWEKQWSLYNTGSITKKTNGLDLNVVHAWMQGITGEGIVISVVDDGLDHSHPDLTGNYDKAASYNYVDFMKDPTPPNRSKQTHGTSCAGIISMKKNTGNCGAGVAYDSHIGGIRINITSSSDIIESSALGYQNQYIDIYSNSWGPSDSGYTVDGPGELLTTTIENGAMKGRNGLGNIYVWASGNGGKNGDSCAADGYASSIYTIAVGSADESGRQAEHDESCASKMAVTFSFNSATYAINNEKSNGQVLTTLTNQQCTDSFTGSSASAPLTAGAIALALNINSLLTWRDIQYLIAYTSDPSKLQEGHWTTNGGGLKVSHEFGFGAIDVEAMVTRARYWITVPQRVSCFIRPKRKVSTIYRSEPLTTFFNVNYKKCSIKYIEHVVIKMTLKVYIDDQYDYPDYYGEDYIDENPFIIFFNGPRRGAITVELHSPHGTPSYLLPKRKFDFVNNEGYYKWPFSSVQHWGESPYGLWNISVRFGAQGGHIKMSNLSMTLYGTEEIPDAIQRIPSQCDQNCARGCSYGNGSEYCDECQSLRMVDSLLCVSSCPTNYCNVAGYCEECPHALTGTIVAAIVVPTVSVALVIIGVAVTGICLYRKCRSQEGYTEF